ncbi:MAG: SsrA-binding protein SmpB [Candidatus Eremiobacterota bacterium]
MSAEPKERNIAVNRKARHEYHILETLECGLVLVGTEVKSLREGKANLTDAYGVVQHGEVWLYGLHISPFDKGNRFNHDPVRPRKLLLHREEIRRLIGKTKEKGLTLVPLRLYFSNQKVKLELALVKGKKLHDKREAEAAKDARREIERAVRVSVR